jgi:hypothetical protein
MPQFTDSGHDIRREIGRAAGFRDSHPSIELLILQLRQGVD